MTTKEKIEISNLKIENQSLRKEIKVNEESFKSICYYMTKSFEKATKDLIKEIKSLKDKWANKEADLILKKIKEKIK